MNVARRKKRNMHKGSGIKLGRHGQNGKKNVCHSCVRMWAGFNCGESWHRS